MTDLVKRVLNNRNDLIERKLKACAKENIENAKQTDLHNIDYLQAEIVSLRSLLRDCKPYVQKEMENIIKSYGTGNCDWIWKTSYLLTRINEIIEE